MIVLAKLETINNLNGKTKHEGVHTRRLKGIGKKVSLI